MATHHHLTQQFTPIETYTLTAPNSSLFPGSISIELNHFHPGASNTFHKKAQAKNSQISSPPSTKITNFPSKISQPSHSTLTPEINILHTPLIPSPPVIAKPKKPMLQINPHKKKRHRLSNPSNPHKKGLAAPSFDHLISDDMDTSYPEETQDLIPINDPPYTPKHFFKPARKGKKVAQHSFFTNNSGDSELSPKPS